MALELFKAVGVQFCAAKADGAPFAVRAKLDDEVTDADAAVLILGVAIGLINALRGGAPLHDTETEGVAIPLEVALDDIKGVKVMLGVALKAMGVVGVGVRFIDKERDGTALGIGVRLSEEDIKTDGIVLILG